jgi:hypothetical protein
MRPKKPAPDRPDFRPKITRVEDAETLVASALAALDRLEPLIQQETELFRVGRVREALGLALEKNEAAQSYTLCLEFLKSNAIAIGRFQPASLEDLRQRHEAFARLMNLNMAVVATARTVSEGLLRELADTIGQNGSPKTYHRSGITDRKVGTAPLALSKAI